MKAAEVTQKFASSEIQGYAESLTNKVQDIDTRLEQLKQKGEDLAGDAKQQWEEQLGALKEKRTKLQKDLDQLRGASGEAWQDLKRGIDAAWNDLVMEQLSNLKLIATRSTGFDHIPLDLCPARSCRRQSPKSWKSTWPGASQSDLPILQVDDCLSKGSSFTRAIPLLARGRSLVRCGSEAG